MRKRWWNAALVVGLGWMSSPWAAAAPAGGGLLPAEDLRQLVSFLSSRIEAEMPGASEADREAALTEALEMMGVKVPDVTMTGPEAALPRVVPDRAGPRPGPDADFVDRMLYATPEPQRAALNAQAARIIQAFPYAISGRTRRPPALPSTVAASRSWLSKREVPEAMKPVPHTRSGAADPYLPAVSTLAGPDASFGETAASPSLYGAGQPEPPPPSFPGPEVDSLLHSYEIPERRARFDALLRRYDIDPPKAAAPAGRSTAPVTRPAAPTTRSAASVTRSAAPPRPPAAPIPLAAPAARPVAPPPAWSQARRRLEVEVPTGAGPIAPTGLPGAGAPLPGAGTADFVMPEPDVILDARGRPTEMSVLYRPQESGDAAASAPAVEVPGVQARSPAVEIPDEIPAELPLIVVPPGSGATLRKDGDLSTLAPGTHPAPWGATLRAASSSEVHVLYPGSGPSYVFPSLATGVLEPGGVRMLLQGASQGS